MVVYDRLRLKCATLEGRKAVLVDHCVLNNDKALEIIRLMEEEKKHVLSPEQVLVIQDQVIPPNSPAVSTAQQKLMAFARQEGTEYFYGAGMASHILLDSYVKEGDTVVSADPDISMVGAKGALGIRLPMAKLGQAIVYGKAIIPEPEIFRVRLDGELPALTDIRAAAIMLVSKLKAQVKENTVIEFYLSDGVNLDENEKAILCGWMQKTGALSALMAEGAVLHADYCFDLRHTISVCDQDGLLVAVKALPESEVRVVFIGGSYGGFLSDIQKTAALLRGKKVAYKVRLIVAPATSDIYAQAAEHGYLEDIMASGGMIINQCGNPAVQARIGEGETMVSNDIHNDPEYAGPMSSQIYLTAAYDAVQCALTGTIGEEERG